MKSAAEMTRRVCGAIEPPANGPTSDDRDMLAKPWSASNVRYGRRFGNGLELRKLG